MPPGAPVQLIARLVEICGREHVLTHPHEPRPTDLTDSCIIVRSPVAAVLPGTAAQVREVVLACAEAGVPWVARGAGTGLSGGALPTPTAS